MQVERRVSGQFVKWLFGTARGAPVSTKLRAAGLDLEALASDYPADRLPGWLSMLSSALHPGELPAEALRRVGFDAVSRGKGASGSSLQQVMTELPETVQRIGNFMDVSVKEHGPMRYVAHFDDVAFAPTFFLGVVQGVTSASTPHALEVVWSPEGLSGARYDISCRSCA